MAGDPDAFGEIVRRHRDRLWAVALRTMGDPDDAADGLQDGLVAAYRRASTFRGDSAVTTWLHRVVVNACLDRHRAARVRRADPLPDDLGEQDAERSSAAVGARAAADPAEVSVAVERREQVLAALAELPAPQRAALVLVDMEGYPMAEVALMLDCEVGTVKSRCSRGRRLLAGRLRHLIEDAVDPDGPPAGNPPASRSVPSSPPPRGPPATA